MLYLILLIYLYLTIGMLYLLYVVMLAFNDEDLPLSWYKFMDNINPMTIPIILQILLPFWVILLIWHIIHIIKDKIYK